jgi:hypothetical protein
VISDIYRLLTLLQSATPKAFRLVKRFQSAASEFTGKKHGNVFLIETIYITKRTFMPRFCSYSG